MQQAVILDHICFCIWWMCLVYVYGKDWGLFLLDLYLFGRDKPEWGRTVFCNLVWRFLQSLFGRDNSHPKLIKYHLRTNVVLKRKTPPNKGNHFQEILFSFEVINQEAFCLYNLLKSCRCSFNNCQQRLQRDQKTVVDKGWWEPSMNVEPQ